MTSETLRKAATILMALADGKTVKMLGGRPLTLEHGAAELQGSHIGGLSLCEIEPDPEFMEFDPKTVPRDAWVRGRHWAEDEGSQIAHFSGNGIRVRCNEHVYFFTWKQALKSLVFVDNGEPFGLVVEGG